MSLSLQYLEKRVNKHQRFDLSSIHSGYLDFILRLVVAFKIVPIINGGTEHKISMKVTRVLPFCLREKGGRQKYPTFVNYIMIIIVLCIQYTKCKTVCSVYVLQEHGT